LGRADFFYTFGSLGDVPFVGDFDGDGADEVGVRSPTTGRVSLKWDLTEGPADYEFIYGISGDIPMAADWNGDGVDTLALYRPSTGMWYIRLSHAGGLADHAIHFRANGSKSLPIHGQFWP
jgi:hypothetical protein